MKETYYRQGDRIDQALRARRRAKVVELAKTTKLSIRRVHKHVDYEIEKGRCKRDGEYIVWIDSRMPRPKKAAVDGQVVIQDEVDESAFPEGRERFGMHRILERDPSISKKAKQKRLREANTLECDVCGFNFARVYGELGEGFIEAHHTVAVSVLDGRTKTKITDLALVCSNCHRMLHRGKLIAVKELRELIQANASK